MIRLSLFPPLVWIVLLGMLLTRTAFFMAWPFLAIVLHREFHVPPARIGAILGAAAMVSTCAGFYAGNLSDRFGRRTLMIAGSVGETVALMVLAVAGSVTTFAAGAFLGGLSRAALEGPGKALIADHVSDRARRELAYHARYFLINVGAAIGPLLGLWLGVAGQQTGFGLAAVAYGVFAIVFAWVFHPAADLVGPASHEQASVRAAVRVLALDRRFLLLLVAMFLSLSAYAQQESTLVQYLNQASGDVAIRLVAGLLVTNAVTIVVFQFPLLALMRRHDFYVRTYVGLTLFGAAFLAYAWLPVKTVAPWIVATWVLSVGEAILFPSLNIQVDRVAPEGLKGSYFGAAGLSGLGFSAGPFVGGVLLQYSGGPLTFVITTMMVCAAALCYRWSSRVGIRNDPMLDVSGVA